MRRPHDGVIEMALFSDPMDTPALPLKIAKFCYVYFRALDQIRQAGELYKQAAHGREVILVKAPCSQASVSDLNNLFVGLVFRVV